MDIDCLFLLGGARRFLGSAGLCRYFRRRLLYLHVLDIDLVIPFGTGLFELMYHLAFAIGVQLVFLEDLDHLFAMTSCTVSDDLVTTKLQNQHIVVFWTKIGA